MNASENINKQIVRKAGHGFTKHYVTEGPEGNSDFRGPSFRGKLNFLVARWRRFYRIDLRPQGENITNEHADEHQL